MIKVIYVLIAVAVLAGIYSAVSSTKVQNQILEEDEMVACTLDAMMCSDGSYVGRSGPNCEFAACPVPNDDSDNGQDKTEDKSDLIRVSSPAPLSVINSPLTITGEARGNWFFEASFPITLVNWDGLIIAEGIATAEGEWTTEDFVPFSAELEFVSPYAEGNPDFMKRGALILKKDNPSGLPEHDDVLEITISFAQ
ncbi:MAG: hypothetical protein KBC78_03265 [Candidatus Pacebacteria bacterium]|nr:hypothetical protein [Candidatus Paceibacterota bacterium]